MSNHLAIAAATSTLKKLLEQATELVNGASVTVGRPTQEESPTRINLYLYQISPNASLRNFDLPSRREDGTVVQRPQAAIDLHYLLTFYGKERDLEPQILLGSAVRVLHTQPILTQDMIRRELERNSDPAEVDRIEALAEGDLADQVERIRFTPQSLSLDELSKLWSVFYQVPYTLSVAYIASVVLIEADVSPQKALPVRTPLIYVETFQMPVIEEVYSDEDKNAMITAASTVIIKGRQLKGDTTVLRIGAVEVTIDANDAENSASDTKITLWLGSALFSDEPLRAGVQGIQVVHPRMMGIPEEEHLGFESNAKPFVLHPTVTPGAVTSTEMTLTFSPPVGKTQRVFALLNQLGSGSTSPRAYILSAPPNNGITEDDVTETDSVVFSLDGVQSGVYLLRVQVDGAESPLERAPDPNNPRYTRPQVIVP